MSCRARNVCAENQLLTTNNRSTSAANASNLQVPGARLNRPGMGTRQPSIGIRRMASSQALRQAAQNGTSGAPLQPSTSRLAPLDENCALEHAPSNTSDPSSTTNQEQPGRLRKASIALLNKLSPKKEPDQAVGTDGAAAELPANPPREYAASMVDVLDTVGTSLWLSNSGRSSNSSRS